MSKNPEEYKSPYVTNATLMRGELTRRPCLGKRCWPKGKTFMSPDPTKITRCDDCKASEGRYREPRSSQYLEEGAAIC